MKNLIILLFFSLIVSEAIGKGLPDITIKGKSDAFKDGDSVAVFVINTELPVQYLIDPNGTYFKSEIVNGSFSVHIPDVSHPVYIRILYQGISKTKGTKKVSVIKGDTNVFRTTYLVESGQEVNLETISGLSPLLYCQYLVDNVSDVAVPKVNLGDQAVLKQYLDAVDNRSKLKLKILDGFYSKISQSAYVILRSDIICENFNLKYLLIRFPEINKRTLYEAVSQSSQLRLSDDLTSDLALVYSINLPAYVLNKYYMDSCMSKVKRFDVDGCYRYIKQCFSGPLKEVLTVYLVLSRYKQNPSVADVAHDALDYVQNSNRIDYLRLLLKQRLAGALAYDFSFPDAQGIVRRLSDYKGKVVVLDFWFTGCIPCRQLAPVLDSVRNIFRKKDVEFISISPDKDKVRWLKSVESGLYSSPASVNLYTGGGSHEIYSYMDVREYPTLFIIDKNGRIGGNVHPRSQQGKQEFINLVSEFLER